MNASPDTNVALEQEPRGRPTLAALAKSPKALDRSLVRSVAWNVASDWGTQIFSWLSFLVVMRLLTPADFGISALSVILMPYLGQLTGLGIPRAVLALPMFSEDELAQLTTVNIIMGTFCFVMGTIFAKTVAAFFRTPALAPVFIVSCFGLILSGACGVPNSLLARQMRFRFLSILGISMTLLGAALVLIMALMGFGYWSLIIGNMIPAVIRTIIILRARPCRLAWPRMSAIREPLRFGFHLSVSTIALNAYERLDNFVAGRVLGQTALGLYGNAWELANVPLEKVATMVTTVIPAYLAAVQDDQAALRRYLFGLTEVLAMAAFPACVGLGLVASEFVPIVFGHKWDGMIGPLQVLSYYAALRSIIALLPKVLTAVHKVKFVMWIDLAALFLLPVAFYIGSFRGITGIAWGWVVAYPLIFLPMYHQTFQLIGVKVLDYLRALRPAFTATVVMIPAVEWAKYRLFPTGSLLTRLIVEIAVGAIVYIGTLWLLHKDRVLVVIKLVKSLFSKKNSSEVLSAA